MPRRNRELRALLDPARPLSEEEHAAIAAEQEPASSDDALREALAQLRGREAAEPAFTARVMAAVENRPRGWYARLRDALVRPRLMRFNLAMMAPAAAVVLALGGLATHRLLAPSSDAVAPVAQRGEPKLELERDELVPVRFALTAPSARQVAVAGDFNGWDTHAVVLRDDDGDGVWTATVPIEPGRYAYQFVVDGERWQADPAAEAVEPDGFGGENSVLRI